MYEDSARKAYFPLSGNPAIRQSGNPAHLYCNCDKIHVNYTNHLTTLFFKKANNYSHYLEKRRISLHRESQAFYIHPQRCVPLWMYPCP
jgi:hypothetical protein